MPSIHWKIVALEETHLWNKVVIESTGRIWGLYLFAANHQVHCCEITPSYELNLIESITERAIDDDTFDDVRNADAFSEQMAYWHCSAIDRIKDEFFHDFGVREINDELTYEDALAEMLDYCGGNQNVPRAVSITQERTTT